ncbi:hypothetical protein CCP2SC5_880019 [Azospirillaceae bacterium]
MRYTVEHNFVDVIGKIWMPSRIAAYRYNLTKHDIDNIGKFTRKNILAWLDTHASDFQTIQDFYATIGDKEIGWKNDESGYIFDDCMYGAEE